MGEIQIRRLKSEDARNFFELNLLLDKETEYMMWEPSERMEKKEMLIEHFKKIPGIETTIQLVAEDGGKLVGHLGGMIGGKNRVKHCLYIFMGVIKDYWNQGIGSKLLEEIENEARKHQIERLELSCDHDNDAGNRLYQKMEYVVEGRKKKAIKTSNCHKDLIMYSKFL